MSFEKATKKHSKLRAAIVGPAGSGKTYTALQLATYFKPKLIGVIDTERGSASKYSDLFEFVAHMPADGDPRALLKDIDEAKRAGVDFLVIDSLSHYWSGKNGVLEKVDQMGGNKFSSGWKTYSPIMGQIVDALLTYPGHVVCTMRTKTEYVVETNEKGQSIPRKVGLAPVQRDNLEYEFDFLMALGSGKSVEITKQRGCPDLEAFMGSRVDLDGKVFPAMKAWIGNEA